MESFILITGLILFSTTTTYDLHHKAVDAQKAGNVKTSIQVEKVTLSRIKQNNFFITEHKEDRLC